MPMHDWRGVPAALYHDCHHGWTIASCDALIAGLLPPGHSRMAFSQISQSPKNNRSVPRPSRPPGPPQGRQALLIPGLNSA